MHRLLFGARLLIAGITYTRLAGKGPVQSHFLFSTLVIITKETLLGAIVFHSGGVDVQ